MFQATSAQWQTLRFDVSSPMRLTTSPSRSTRNVPAHSQAAIVLDHWHDITDIPWAIEPTLSNEFSSPSASYLCGSPELQRFDGSSSIALAQSHYQKGSLTACVRWKYSYVVFRGTGPGQLYALSCPYEPLEGYRVVPC